MESGTLLRFAADALLLLHVAFVVFVVLGGLLLARHPGLAWLHFPAVTWAVAVEAAGWICPLTPWEQRLRVAAGAGGYRGGFLDHYLVPLLYPAGLTREMQWLLAAGVLAVNAFAYLRLWRRRRGREGGSA